MADEPTHAYVALKDCDCIVGAYCDDEAGVPSLVGEWLQDGLSVKRITLEEAKQRMEKTFGNCEHSVQP